MNRYLLLSLLTLTAASSKAEQAYTTVETALKHEPSFKAETILTLPAKTAVDAQKRKGGWKLVTLTEQDKNGWVRMLDLRIAPLSEQTSEDDPIMQSFKRVNIGLGGDGSAAGTLVRGIDARQTSGTAIRGLTAADIASASPDLNAVLAMEDLSADATAAKQFAMAAALEPQQIGYFKESSSWSVDTGDSTPTPGSDSDDGFMEDF